MRLICAATIYLFLRLDIYMFQIILKFNAINMKLKLILFQSTSNLKFQKWKFLIYIMKIYILINLDTRAFITFGI